MTLARDPQLSTTVTKALHSGLREISDLAMDRPGTIRLELGQPDFATPAYIAAAGKRAIDDGWTGYTQTAGVPALRERLAAKLAAVNGISVPLSSGGRAGPA
jgi:aspartate aminotransferase